MTFSHSVSKKGIEKNLTITYREVGIPVMTQDPEALVSRHVIYCNHRLQIRTLKLVLSSFLGRQYEQSEH